MRIAYIGIKGLPSRGGAERAVEAITERLKEKHNLTVYCNTRYTPQGTSISGVRLIRIHTLKGKYLQPVSLLFFSALHALFFGRYDLVHVHNMEACFVLPLLLPRYRVIATAHGQPYRVERWGRVGKMLLRLTEYFFIHLPHVRTSVSLPFAKYCESRYHRKVHYIPNGVEITEDLSPPTCLRRSGFAQAGSSLISGLVRDAESAERGSFIENPPPAQRASRLGEETRILNKASGLRPETDPTGERDFLFAPVHNRDKQKNSSLSDLCVSAVKPYILFAAGRIIPSKGCHLLLKAFREIKADIELHVVGNLDVMPGYARELRELAGGRVKFIPFIDSREELSRVIKDALFFVFPSSLEAMSMMLLEVAASGTPILSSDIPENRAVLEDRALYFSSGDGTDLMNQLRWAIEHPADMKKKGYVSQDWVKQNYPWDKIVDQYNYQYQTLINRS